MGSRMGWKVGGGEEREENTLAAARVKVGLRQAYFSLQLECGAHKALCATQCVECVPVSNGLIRPHLGRVFHMAMGRGQGPAADKLIRTSVSEPT